MIPMNDTDRARARAIAAEYVAAYREWSAAIDAARAKHRAEYAAADAALDAAEAKFLAATRGAKTPCSP